MHVLFLPIFIVGFLLSIFLAFYIPGIVVTKSDKLSGFPQHVIAIIVGMVLWGWQGYLFGYAGIRWASYIYLIVCAYFYIKGRLYDSMQFQMLKKNILRIDWLLFSLLIIGVIAQTVYYWKFGFLSADGISHVSYNIHDHYWHASMIREMIDRFPPFEPGMVGLLKTNYHYWFNLVTAELIRVFYLPAMPTQALGMYTFGSVLLGLLLYVLGRSLHASKAVTYWLIFFFYFASDISSWVVFYMQKNLSFSVPSLIEDGSNFMDNPPRAFSVLVALAAIYLFFRYIDKKYTNIAVLGILFGTLVGFKVYTAIGLLVGLAVVSVYQTIFKRRFDTWLIFIIALFLSVIIFFPVNGNSGGIFFLPFEKARDFITYKPLGYYDMEMRWRIFEVHNNIPRMIHLGFIMTAIYLLIQFGFKFLGIIPYKKTLDLLGKEKIIFCIAIVGISFIGGTFISLKANPAESYNFYLPGTLILSVLASISLTLFLNKKPLSLIYSIVFVLIILGSPRWFYRITTQMPSALTEFSGVSYSELASYEFLKKETPNNSIVLVLNKDKKDYFSAIVKVYSGRDMFLSGQAISNAHNTTSKERIGIVNTIYTSQKPQEVTLLTKKNNINYLYFYGKPNLTVSPESIGGRIVFQNQIATIIKLDTN